MYLLSQTFGINKLGHELKLYNWKKMKMCFPIYYVTLLIRLKRNLEALITV